MCVSVFLARVCKTAEPIEMLLKLLSTTGCVGKKIQNVSKECPGHSQVLLTVILKLYLLLNLEESRVKSIMFRRWHISSTTAAAYASYEDRSKFDKAIAKNDSVHFSRQCKNSSTKLTLG